FLREEAQQVLGAPVERRGVPCVGREQRLDARTQRGVSAARALEQRRALRRLDVEQLAQELERAGFPCRVVHYGFAPGTPRSIASASHARATRQSRLTVGSETSSAAAVSSMESPAKNRHSTTLACRGCTASSAVNAASRARMSVESA